MNGQNRVYNQNMLLGCGLAMLIVVASTIILLVLAANRELQAMRYPGAGAIALHTNYTIQRRYMRLDNAYYTSDPLAEIRNWYTRHFNLRIVEEDGECVSLEVSTKRVAIQRYTTVSICAAPTGQTIFITRAISPRLGQGQFLEP
jgi:hypothetical protein